MNWILWINWKRFGFFQQKFDEQLEFYNLRHMDEIFNYISKYKGIVILLNELKHYLIGLEELYS